MGNYFKDNDDLRYYFDKGIDWGPVVEITEKRFEDEGGHENLEEALEFYGDIADMFGQFVADEVAPHAAEIDASGLELVDGEVVFPDRLNRIFEQLKDLDLHGLNAPRELGGMNAPMLLYFVNAEMFARADVSTMAHHSFHGGIAMAALVFSVTEGSTEIDPDKLQITKTRWQDAIGEMIRGEAWGCMDITEPDAGSDMAQLRATGTLGDDGVWRVSGEKIFITSGHGKWHFVIARTEEAGDPEDPMAGLSGLSMFFVPAYHDRPDGTRERVVALSRLEEKLGHHGSATCGLVFDEAPAMLVGERGEGFKYMLTLMNNARLGVGFECLGLCEAAYRTALGYAQERRSMGKSIDHHEMIFGYLEAMRSDIEGIRAIAMTAGYHEELAQKAVLAQRYYPNLSEVERKQYEKDTARHKRIARRLTPLLKYFAAEQAVEHARMGLQIHGGNGYITEYGAEKLLRDALVMPIYEGTSQIQALMAMKDTLGGAMKDPQRFVRRLAQARWRSMSARDPLERRVAKLQVASLSAQQHLLFKTAGDKAKGLRGKPLSEWPERFLKNWDPKRDFAFAMLHAERLIQLLTAEAVAELLLDQAQRHDERRDVLERWLDRWELRAKHLSEEITTTGEGTLARLERYKRVALADAAE